MSLDQDIEFRKCWARANAGRMVRVIANSGGFRPVIGSVGTLCAMDRFTGEPIVGFRDRMLIGTDKYIETLIPDARHGYYVEHADVEFTDGRPAIIPRLVNGEWTWDGKEPARKVTFGGVAVGDKAIMPRCGWVNDDGQQCTLSNSHPPGMHDFPARGLPDPYALAAGDAKKTERAPIPDPLQAAALRTLHFLADLVPLPGWAPSTERELMACVRELKAAMKGKKS